jgi:hypothetical protein
VEVGSEDANEEKYFADNKQGYTHVKSFLYSKCVVTKKSTFGYDVTES